MEVRQKEARIRIPTEKLFAANVDDSFSFCNLFCDDRKGTWSLHMCEDEQAFIQNEKVFHVKGDHHMVEPIIHFLMGIVNS